MKERDDSRQALTCCLQHEEQCLPERPGLFPSPKHLSKCRTKQSPFPGSPHEPSSSQAHAKPSPAPSHSNQLPDFMSSAHPRNGPFSAARCHGAKPFLSLRPQTPPRMPALLRISRFTAQVTRPTAFPDASCLWGMRSRYPALFSLSICCALYQAWSANQMGQGWFPTAG